MTSQIKGDSFPTVRDQATSYTVFKNYFDLLSEALTKYGIKDQQAQIYNCDETGMLLEHKMPKLIAAKGTKKIQRCTSGTKSQISILACASASGQTMPPLVVFTGKHLNSVLAKGEVPATSYGMSSSDWMDQDSRNCLLNIIFLPEYAVTSRPLILLLDGHS